MKVKELLKKENMYDKSLSPIDYHMRLFYYDVSDLKNKFPELKNKNDQEVGQFILDIYDKCNSESPNYDSNFDMEITRMTLRTDVYGTSGYNWNDGNDSDIGIIYEENIEHQGQNEKTI